ncbi:MAG: RNA-binding protein [Polyangia bacterium]|jgi:RNA recognition motif-containing protein|nr:RNA-binding protein [Polyangia bacterium]
MKIYVGNLPFGTDDAALQTLFESYGAVDSANVVMDRDTGRSRGFGFVEMSDAAAASAAIQALDNQPFDGRNLRVNEARPRPSGGGRQRSERY